MALDVAFTEPGPAKPKKTRAIIVVYDGRLVAERYAPGFNKDMPLLGWSMSKIGMTSAVMEPDSSGTFSDEFIANVLAALPD